MGGVKNGKFVTLTTSKKNRPKTMKPPRPTQRKFASELRYSTTKKFDVKYDQTWKKCQKLKYNLSEKNIFNPFISPEKNDWSILSDNPS